MLDVQGPNLSAPEEPVQFERIGDPADDQGASQIIQIDAFNAVRFQMIPKRTGIAMECKAHHTVSSRRIFDAKLGAYTFGTAHPEGVEALRDDRSIRSEVHALRQNLGP